MLAVLLLLVAGLFVVSAVKRYRGDRAATVAGIVAALGATLGFALGFGQTATSISLRLVLILGGVAVVAAIVGTLYAERRRNRISAISK